MVKTSEMIRTIKYGVNQIAHPYYEICEALGDPYDPNEFDNPFEFEQWRNEAGLEITAPSPFLAHFKNKSGQLFRPLC